MKFYKAKIRDTKSWLTFNGEVLIVSNPELFEVLLKSNVSRSNNLFLEDLEIVESEWEKIHEY